MTLRLAVVGLTCERGARRVFAGRSFALESGQGLAVTGANGAGKSSLLRILAGLLRPAGGRVDWAEPGSERSLPEAAHYVGHQDPLKPALSVSENLRFWRDWLGGDAPVEAALTKVALAPLADLPAGYLSAGQRRRLSLARLFTVPRPVWLLDEPATALDADSQDILRDAMRAHLAGGGIVIAATHAPLGIDALRELRL